MSTSNLFRLSALAALVSGVCIIVGNVLDLLLITQVGPIIGLFSPVFGLFALTGVYLWQREQAGVFGSIGYIGAFFGLALVVGIEYADTLIFPHIEENVLGGLMTGPVGMIFVITALIYLAGIILFGISVIIARVFSWIAALIVMIGFALTLLFAFLPETLVHIGGIVAGVGIFWFGVSLWSFSAKRAS
jgi:hypothetical protein